MKLFDKPKNLNGTELKKQLADVGIVVKDIFDFADGTIGFETDDESSAAAIVAVHNGTIIAPEPTVADKLARAGLSIDDLKSALGL